MLGRVLANYKHSVARILLNGSQSEQFPLTRGTRQGCPVSPLLFAMLIEPFAERICRCLDISGVAIWEGRSQNYADDVLLVLTKPKQSLPIL